MHAYVESFEGGLSNPDDEADRVANDARAYMWMARYVSCAGGGSYHNLDAW